jgi:hypothetical protein
MSGARMGARRLPPNLRVQNPPTQVACVRRRSYGAPAPETGGRSRRLGWERTMQALMPGVLV